MRFAALSMYKNVAANLDKAILLGHYDRAIFAIMLRKPRSRIVFVGGQAWEFVARVRGMTLPDLRIVLSLGMIVGGNLLAERGPFESAVPLFVKMGDPDGTVDHWDPENRVATESAEFSPDDQFFATVSKSRISGNSVVRLWKAESAEIVWTRATDGETEAVTFTRDGAFIVTGGEGSNGQGSLKIWNTEDGSLVRAIGASVYAKSIEGMRLSPDGGRLATGDESSHVTIWDTSNPSPESWEILFVLNMQDTDSVADVNQVDWTDDGRFLMTAERDGDVALYDTRVLNSDGLPEKVRAFEGFKGRGSVKSVRISPDNKMVAAGCAATQGVRLWDLDTGKLIAHIPSGSAPDNPEKAPLCAERCEAVEFTNDSQYLLVGGTWPSWAVDQYYEVPISVFRVDDLLKNPPSVVPNPATEIETWRTEYIDFNGYGDRMLTSHDDGSVRLWSLPIKSR